MSEAIYDKDVAPLLAEASRICKEHNLPMLAVVEYEPKNYGETAVQTPDQSLTMSMTHMASRSRGNLDSLVISILRFCNKYGIDTSASIVANQFAGSTVPSGVPLPPDDQLIDAADKHADNYEGHEIPANEVRAAICNAFYAGAKFAAASGVKASHQSRAREVTAMKADGLVSITVGGSTHTRTAAEWLALARDDLRRRTTPPPPGYAVAPKELWLQLHGDCHESELEEPVDYEGSDDVTWCWHRIHESDVHYVRADIAGVPEAPKTTDGGM